MTRDRHLECSGFLTEAIWSHLTDLIKFADQGLATFMERSLYERRC